MSTADSVRSRTMDSTSRPTYPTSVNLLASTFRKGLAESFASRRAISVFPTPVGPIIRMFLGVTSAAISAGRRWRRMRFRIATATARLAAACPTTWRSSSATICRGVRVSTDWCRASVDSGRWIATTASPSLKRLDRDLLVRVHADLAGDLEGLGGQRARVHGGVAGERARRGQRVGTAAADGDDAVVGRDDVPGAGEQEGGVSIRHHEEGLQPAQHAVGAPFLGQLDGGALEAAAILLDLGLELREQRHGVGGRAREPGQDLAVVEAADLARGVLHDRAPERHLAVAGDGGVAALADGEDRGAVDFWEAGHVALEVRRRQTSSIGAVKMAV